MAKNMALIEDGVVVGILWYSDYEPETDSLKNIDILSSDVGIGDTFDGSHFYHDGECVLTQNEQNALEISNLKDSGEQVNQELAALKDENASLREENTVLMECLLEMSEVVYA